MVRVTLRHVPTPSLIISPKLHSAQSVIPYVFDALIRPLARWGRTLADSRPAFEFRSQIRRVQSSVFQRRCISVQALTSLMASESILKAWGILLQGRIRPNFCLNSFDWEFKRLFEAWVSSAENPEGRRSYVTGIFCHFSQGYVLLNCRFALLIERYGVSWVTAASFCRGERKDVWKKRCGRPVTLWNPGLSCIYSLDRK